MGIPFHQTARIGAYVLKQHLSGRKRYPLVLMLEPLFRCNLACAGCGKIDYPDKILNQRVSYDDAMRAIDECGAPVVSIAGGEPLLHKEMPQIVRGAIAKKKFVTLCTNALLMEKKLDQYEPSPYFNWSVHLDGDEQMHDKSVCQTGVYDKAVSAIKAAKAKGFRVNINTTLFNDTVPEKAAAFFDAITEIGIDGITVSPGYAYERAPDQQHFLNRAKTKELFRGIFSRGKGGKAWPWFQSPLFLDFLAGNQTYNCTPVGQPDLHGVRLAEALLPARRRLRQDLRRADERDRVGKIRHRQLREMRRLHGPLRLRSHRREGCGPKAVEDARPRHQGDQDERADGAGNLAREPAPRRIHVLAACAEQDGRDRHRAPQGIGA